MSKKKANYNGRFGMSWIINKILCKKFTSILSNEKFLARHRSKANWKNFLTDITSSISTSKKR